MTEVITDYHGTMGKTAQYSVAMADDKLEVVFVAGRPGSGKKTVCKKIGEEFGYAYISTGELLRQERRKEESPYRDLIDRHYSEGSLVPPNTLLTLLGTAVAESKSYKFLIDAFPINIDNLEAWNRSGLSHKMTLSFVLFLECSQEVCESRILHCVPAGSGRDNEVLEKRFTRYEEETLLVVSHFRQRGLLQEVDATNSPEDVYQKVRRFFQTA